MSRDPYQLYDYHVWANDCLLSHLKELPGEVFHAEVTSVFPSVADTFAHMYLFEQLYLAVLREESNDNIFPKIPGWTAEAKDKTVDEMRQLFARVAEQFRELLARTSDPHRAMTITHPKYGSLATHFSDILQHIVNHGTYHRGNVTAMLRQQGHGGVPTDYIFYLMERQVV